MTRFTLLLLFIAISSSAFTQEMISGKVLNQHTNEPISGVFISSSKDTTITDALGEFSLIYSKSITIQVLGYESEIISNPNNELNIYLTPSTIALNEVTIHAGLKEEKIKNTASSVNLVSKEMIRRDDPFSFTNSLNRVPGVHMHSGAFNTNRITIRGIGSRSLYGTTKIKAYFDQIPLTDGSGNSTIEDIDQSLIDRIEVLKGPNSSAYGAGLAGVVKLHSVSPESKGVSLKNGMTIGSYGTFRWNSQFSFKDEKKEFTLAYSKMESDGYRDNSEYRRDQVGFSGKLAVGPKSEIAILSIYTNLKAYIPSSINEDDFQNNPEKAAFNWNAAKGFESYDKVLTGISFNHKMNNNWEFSSSVFGKYRDAYEPRPFDILAEKTTSVGTRNLITNQTGKWKISGGFELFRDFYAWGTFNNDAPMGGSAKGERESGYWEDRFFYNIFSEISYSANEKLQLSGGLNLNKTNYLLEDRFDQDSIDQSGDYSFETMLSPRVGLVYHLTNFHHIFTNVSHGFSPPTLEETLKPDGQINLEIQPEQGWNYELGIRGNLSNLSYDFVGYYMKIQDLLVAERTGNDQFAGVNAGLNTHYGLDLLVNYTIDLNQAYTLNIFNSLSWMKYRFDEFTHEGIDYSGNQLTGVPGFTLSPGVELLSRMGLYGNLNGQYVGEIPMNDANELYSNEYFIVRTRVGYKVQVNKLLIDVHFGINNILNESYASMLLINAVGFGGNSPRYYYPGKPRNYYGGLSLKYQF